MAALNLSVFCSTDPVRPYLHKPFSRGEWTYATNGHICVRVPRRLDAPEQDNPNAEKLFDTISASAMRLLRSIAFPELISRECECCGGRGTVHDCPDCACDCESCGGDGEVQEKASVGIGIADYNAKYVKQLTALPGLVIASDAAPAEPLFFRFDGGEGLLMPMRVRYINHVDEATE